MIKLAVVVLSVIVVVSSASVAIEPPLPPVPEVVPIVSQQSDSQPDGQYNFGFQAGDGTAQEQVAVVKLVEEKPVLSISGKYEYVDKEGKPYTITYTADENGYRPEGDSLPVAPPIPEAIARALKYNEEHPYIETQT